MPPRKSRGRKKKQAQPQAKRGARRRPAASPKSSSKAVRAALVCAALLTGALGIAFFWIDSTVARRLALRGHDRLPAIYSDARVIERGMIMPDETVRELLLTRDYEEREPPAELASGQFTERGGTFTIHTREITGMSHLRADAVRASYRPSEGALRGLPEGSPLILEPAVLAPLASGTTLAARRIPLREISPLLISAILATEDERFYSHFGIDLIGIARAMVVNLREMRIVQGGSSLTQQLAKNLFFSPERTLMRKLLEAMAAVSLEVRLSKDEILELYLNEVYLGQEGQNPILGVREASLAFFGKEPSDVTLAESAMLAGIIRAPSYYSPRRHPARAKQRRDVVLARLLELERITDAEFRAATSEKPAIVQAKRYQRRAPHYTSRLRQTLAQAFDIDSAALAGARVYTGIDPELQRCAERAVTRGVTTLEKNYASLARRKDRLEAGLVAIEPVSGKVRAWAGGRDFGENQFDHVSQARRQIGSTVKPFIYLTALDGTLNDYRTATTTSILEDRPLAIKVNANTWWEPENYDREFRGDVTLRYALENSLNVPAVYVAQRVGIPTIARTLAGFRLAQRSQAAPSMALGAVEATLLDVTASYASLARGGRWIKPRLYIEAVTSENEPLSTATIEEEQVADPAAVFVLTDILRGVVERGTARGLRSMGYKGEAAGKTGTSSDARDAWFVGYTPVLAAGVWVGFDDNSKIGLTGGTAATPIWGDFMKCAEPYLPRARFRAPAGVRAVEIDISTADRATEYCPEEMRVREVFVEGTEPTQYCTRHTSREPWYRRPLFGSEEDEKRGPERRRKRGFWENLFG